MFHLLVLVGSYATPKTMFSLGWLLEYLLLFSWCFVYVLCLLKRHIYQILVVMLITIFIVLALACEHEVICLIQCIESIYL